MKFEINRLEMLAAAKNTARVAPTRAPVDVLNGILIEGNDNTSEVFLTATNFEVSIQQKVKASIIESGSMLVNAKILVGMLSLLSSEFVTFSADNPNITKVTGDKCVYEINCLLAKHYPKPVMPFPEETVKLTGICSLARRTVFVTSKEESKPILQCVLVKLRQNAVQAAATDGVRMMLAKSEAESTDNQEFLLPGHSLQLLASISSDADTFEVSDMGREIVFMRNNMMFTMRKMPGDFVDVNTVVKSVQPAYSALTNAKQMIDALDLIQIAAGSQPVNLVFKKNAIYMKCDGDNGAMQTEVAASISEVTPTTGFYYNVENLCKLFQVVDGKVKIELDSKGIMLIKSKNEVYLQLPRTLGRAVSEGNDQPQHHARKKDKVVAKAA